MPTPRMNAKEQQAYDEALRKIKKCGARGTELVIASLELTALPPEIGQLSALKALSLRSNQLTALPPQIGQLSALTWVDLSHNKRLAALPPEIGQLTALKTLYLQGNRLTALPPEIGQLSALKELYLNNNQLSALPPAIGQLSALTTLHIERNKLSVLPSEIGQLSALAQLYLYHNQLTTLPPEIGLLSALMVLYLNNNQLTALPPELARPTKLAYLFLHENLRLELPAEVLGPTNIEVFGRGKKVQAADPKAILDYYFTHRQAAMESGTEPLMEAKVLVLGEASVGKSCLIAALTEGKRRSEVPDGGTRGIVRRLWEVPVTLGEMTERRESDSEILRLNCWDFGGQEIYHSAHTLFLTTRAVYLIVISKRDNERQNNVDYWLRMAASFGGPDAVIYVVVNKCDEKVGFPPDDAALRLRHPRLRGFLETICDDLRGIDDARRIIVREAMRLEGVRQPVARAWLAVKKKLEKMPEHTLSMAAWVKLCGQGVSTPEGQRELLHLCDRLGTVRYFPTTKEKMVDACDTAILNPEWVALGIYALLDDEELRKRGGLLDRSQMTAILKARGYPSEHERIIEEVMRRYDLLYDSTDHGLKHRMLIPLMLPERMPDLPWPEKGTLEFRYQYQVMPAGLLPAFVARMHMNLSAKISPWRHGCVLTMNGCQARVIADTERKRVLVSIQGAEPIRRDVLDAIRFTFSSMHGAIEQLEFEELIPVPNRPDAPMLDYSFVRSLEWDEEREFKTKGAEARETITVNVREALEGVRGKAQRERDANDRAAQHSHLHFHQHKTKIAMNRDSHDITITGDVTNTQVGQTLTNCTNMIQQQSPGERKDLLEQLDREVKALIARLPEDKQEVAAGDLEQMVKGATASTPNRRWYSASADGLLEASKYVKDFSGNITGTILNLGKLLWPDFSLPEKK